MEKNALPLDLIKTSNNSSNFFICNSSYKPPLSLLKNLMVFTTAAKGYLQTCRVPGNVLS